MDFNLNNPDLDSLLDDPIEETPQVEVEEQPEEEIPMIPDAEEEDSTTQVDSDTNNSLIAEYLKSYGIEDPGKIQFENEEGGIDEVDFNTLSQEEQLTMLKELGDPGYTDYEKNVVNFMRSNNMNLQDIVDYYSQQAVQNYINSQPKDTQEHSYSIDEYTDDELYMADMKARFPDFTDEEIEEKLNSAKLNEETFKKEIDSLRNYYKSEEDAQAQAAEAQEQQQYEALRNSVLDAANNFREVLLDTNDPNGDALEIEDTDRQQMLSYLLEPGTDGRSEFDKDLSDPAALIELAWLRTHGRDTLNGISQYWKKELADTRKELAKTKKELEKYTKNNNNSVVVSTTKPNKKDVSTIGDIWANV